ncbi:MAG: VCBS repeat-containing protein [Pseudomonadota bacterium]
MSNPTLAALTLVALAVVSACGGGGGSGGASNPPPGGGGTLSPPPAPTINYTGNQSPYAFAEDDADDIALTAVALDAFFQLAEAAWLDLGVTGSIDETVDGDSGSATIQGQLEADFSGFLIVDYNQFTVDNQTFNGRYVQRNNADDGVFPGEFDTLINGSAEFHDLTIAANGSELVLRGRVTSALDGSAVLTANLLVTETASGETAWLDTLVLERSRETLPIESSPNAAVGRRINGRLFDSVLGRLDIQQELPFNFVDAANTLLTSPAEGGRMEILGDGIRLTIFPLNALFVGLVIDQAGADYRARRFEWTELGNDASSLMPASAPVANAGLNITARLGESVFPHTLFSSDPDGDFLQTRWELVLRPVGSVAVLNADDRPEVRLDPDLAGEYLLHATVSDGVTSRTTTSRISISADAESSRQATAHRGKLEGPRQVGVGESSTLSARSWFRSVDERGDQNSWGIPTNSFSSATIDAVSSTSQELVFNVSAPLAARISYMPASRAFSTDARISADTGPAGEDSARLFSELGPAEQIHFADFNNDGLADLIAVVPFDPEDREVFAPEIDGLAIFFASPAGGYEPGILRRGGTGRIGSGDVNSDGLTDIVVTGLDGIFVLRQRADGSVGDPELLTYPRLTCSSSTRPMSGTEQLPVVVDVFGDGRPGIATFDGCPEREFFAWRQNADGTLATGERIPTPEINQSTGYLADIDGDGRLDALFGLNSFNNPAADLLVYRQTDAGDIVEVANLGGACEQFDAPRGVTDDVNGDQRLDVIVVSGCEIAVHYQQADGTFIAGPVTSDTDLPDPVRDVYLADYDRDGDMDLFITGFNNASVLAFQEPDGQYRIAFDLTSEIGSQGLFSIDINADGVSDLATPIREAPLQSTDGATHTIARFFLSNDSN